jgi:hypothetical protein
MRGLQLLKDIQDSELYADVLASRLEGLKGETQTGALSAQQVPQQQAHDALSTQPTEEAPKEDEILSGLSEFDRQRLLSSEPKSLNERVMKKVLQSPNGSNKKEAKRGI